MDPPNFIKRLIAEKRRARRIWHQTGYPNDKHTLNCVTNRLKMNFQNIDHKNSKKA